MGETSGSTFIKNTLFTTLKAGFLIMFLPMSHPKEIPQEKGGGKVSTAQNSKKERKETRAKSTHHRHVVNEA